MTDPLLEFRGLDLLSSGLRIHLTRGFLAVPVPRGTDYVVAAKAGRMSGNRVADVTQLMLEGWITADTAAEWRAATDQLLSVLEETGNDPGDLIVRGEYYGLDVGVTATIAARVKNAVEGPIIGFKKQSWSIELESVDPYWVVT